MGLSNCLDPGEGMLAAEGDLEHHAQRCQRLVSCQALLGASGVQKRDQAMALQGLPYGP